MQITIREPGSAITHFIGMILAMLASMPLLVKAAGSTDATAPLALSIFTFTMVLLYGASTAYHSISVSNRIILLFKKIDHMMIFVLIAGSYTPVCLTVLDERIGHPLLVVVWGIAIAGMAIKAIWVNCPKWFSSILYIAMGWVCVAVFEPLCSTLTVPALIWLAAGGVIYTVGGVIYALKLRVFNRKHARFGSHEIFHLFVIGGSVCHFVFMYLYIA